MVVAAAVIVSVVHYVYCLGCAVVVIVGGGDVVTYI